MPEPTARPGRPDLVHPGRAALGLGAAVGLPVPHPVPGGPALCAEQEPPLRAFGPGHQAACHFPLTEPEAADTQAENREAAS